MKVIPKTAASRGARMPAKPRPLSVFIIEDSQAMLGALLGMFAAIGNIRVVGTASSQEWKMRWAQERAPHWDLLLLDLRLLHGNPLRVIERIKQHARKARVAVFGEQVSPLEQLLCSRLGVDSVFSRAQVRHFIAFVQELALRPTAVHAHSGAG